MPVLIAYLLAFVASFWPHLTTYQWHEAEEIAAEVARLKTSPWKMLRLVNIAASESCFDRTAVNKESGARGPFQVLGGDDFSAREALRRMEVQGMVAFVGCRKAEDRVHVQGSLVTCADLVDHRVGKADLWFMGHEPPQSGNP